MWTRDFDRSLDWQNLFLFVVLHLFVYFIPLHCVRGEHWVVFGLAHWHSALHFREGVVGYNQEMKPDIGYLYLYRANRFRDIISYLCGSSLET